MHKIITMAHCRLLFVGGRNNLQQIFNNAPDSSSKSAAELTIGADWVEDYDWLTNKEKELNKWTTDDFTKENKELYQQVLDGLWYDCYDVRDPNHYGSFDCINCPDFEPYDENNTDKDFKYDKDWDEKEKRNKARAIEAIKLLPSDTLFHFADSHW